MNDSIRIQSGNFRLSIPNGSTFTVRPDTTVHLCRMMVISSWCNTSTQFHSHSHYFTPKLPLIRLKIRTVDLFPHFIVIAASRHKIDTARNNHTAVIGLQAPLQAAISRRSVYGPICLRSLHAVCNCISVVVQLNVLPQSTCRQLIRLCAPD